MTKSVPSPEADYALCITPPPPPRIPGHRISPLNRRAWRCRSCAYGTSAVGGLSSALLPGRNLLFFTLAAAIACRRGLKHLVGGLCETNYSGYPDCRDDTLKVLQVTLNLGMARRFVLHMPLMWIDKAGSWKLAEELGGHEFEDLVREETHSCYLGERSVRQEWGSGCGSCPACELKRRGYERHVGSGKGG